MHQRDAVAALGPFMKCVETKMVTPSRRDRSTSACQNASRATDRRPTSARRGSASRPVDHATASDEALALSERQRVRQLVEYSIQPRSAAPSPRRCARPRRRDVEQARVQLEVLLHRELRRARTASCTRPAASRRRSCASTDRAEQPRRPSLAGSRPGEHLHRRRLAAAVGAEKAEDLAALDAEGHVVDRDEVAKRIVRSRASMATAPSPAAARRDHDRPVAAPLVLRQQRDEGHLERRGRRVRAGSPHEPVASTRPSSIATSQSNRAGLHVGGRDQHASCQVALARMSSTSSRTDVATAGRRRWSARRDQQVRGSWISAQRPSFCFMPPDSLPAAGPRTGRRPVLATSVAMRRSRSGSRARRGGRRSRCSPAPRASRRGSARVPCGM